MIATLIDARARRGRLERRRTLWLSVIMSPGQSEATAAQLSAFGAGLVITCSGDGYSLAEPRGRRYAQGDDRALALVRDDLQRSAEFLACACACSPARGRPIPARCRSPCRCRVTRSVMRPRRRGTRRRPACSAEWRTTLLTLSLKIRKTWRRTSAPSSMSRVDVGRVKVEVDVARREDVAGEAAHPLRQVAQVILPRIDRPHDVAHRVDQLGRGAGNLRERLRDGLLVARRRAGGRPRSGWRSATGSSRCRRAGRWRCASARAPARAAGGRDMCRSGKRFRRRGARGCRQRTTSAARSAGGCES